MFQEQGESVERVENNVEAAHANVTEGEKMLCQAVKYKQGMYPLLGALLGSVLGGPVGLLAGMKLGSLTAVACGFLGINFSFSSLLTFNLSFHYFQPIPVFAVFWLWPN